MPCLHREWLTVSSVNSILDRGLGDLTVIVRPSVSTMVALECTRLTRLGCGFLFLPFAANLEGLAVAKVRDATTPFDVKGRNTVRIILIFLVVSGLLKFWRSEDLL